MQQVKDALLGLAIMPFVFATVALADDHGDENHAKGLVQTVREATRMYRDVALAEADGWATTAHCVNSGGDEGAMGIHYVNLPLLLDGGLLDATRPEVLMYEERDGRKRLTGAEYIVFAAEWDAAHPDGMPPVLMGQLFDYIGEPNRYRLPAIYALHVWAWRDNPNGPFSHWNPQVSCDEYVGEMNH